MWVRKTDSILYNPFIFPLKVMQVYGMYPINNLPNWVFYLHAGIAHCILTVPVPLLACTYLYVNRQTTNLAEIIEVLFMTTQIGITILKYIPVRVYPEKIRKSIEWLDMEEFKTCHPKQENIVHKTSEHCRRVYRYFLIACITLLNLWTFTPLLNNEKRFPNIIWLPFDPYKNDYVFAFIYVMVVIGSTNACFGNSSLDCIIVNLISQAAGQIKVIKGTLGDVIEYSEERVLKEHGNLSSTDNELLKNKYIYEEISNCVDRYNLVKEFVKELEETYSFSLFCQFFASIFVICFGCIKFFFVEIWSIDFLMTVSFTTTTTCEVFLYCYFGSQLYNESSSFVSDIYLTNWFDLDQKCQKAIIIMMEDAKRPLMIRAGKIIDLSLETFATIIRRSYSLLALLNKFNNS